MTYPLSGEIEAAESFADCVRRCVFEELGITITADEEVPGYEEPVEVESP